jgi:hypothetical protein
MTDIRMLSDEELDHVAAAGTRVKIRQNARGGDALAVSAAVIVVGDYSSTGDLTATSGDATATGGDGGTNTATVGISY